MRHNLILGDYHRIGLARICGATYLDVYGHRLRYLSPGGFVSLGEREGWSDDQPTWRCWRFSYFPPSAWKKVGAS